MSYFELPSDPRSVRTRASAASNMRSIVDFTARSRDTSRHHPVDPETLPALEADPFTLKKCVESCPELSKIIERHLYGFGDGFREHPQMLDCHKLVQLLLHYQLCS